MNLESAIVTSTARRTQLVSGHSSLAIRAGADVINGKPSAADPDDDQHKRLKHILRTAGWVHKGTNNNVSAFQHKDGSSLIFQHPGAQQAAAAAPTEPEEEQDPVQAKVDNILALLDPKKVAEQEQLQQQQNPQDGQQQNPEDQPSEDADNYSLALGDQGFDHDNRHQIGGGRVVDVYTHPAGHTAVVQSKNGNVQGWGFNYGRGLGNASGTDTASLQDHLGKSTGFLRKEKGLVKPTK
jgi:hypothetical protein